MVFNSNENLNKIDQIIKTIINALDYSAYLFELDSNRFVLIKEYYKEECIKEFFDEGNISEVSKILTKYNDENHVIINDIDQCAIIRNKREIYIPIFLGNIKTEKIIGFLYLYINDNNFNVESKESTFKKIDELIEETEICNYFNLYYYIEKSIKKIRNIIKLLNRISYKNNAFDEQNAYNLAYFSTIIGEKLGLNEESLNQLYYAALLQDVGNLYLDKKILDKTTSLTSEEMDHIKMHTIYGQAMANLVDDYPNRRISLSNIVRWHHENFDGSGYPDGLIGENIPLECRILRVAGSIEAMLSFRKYKKAKNIPQIIEELKKYKGTYYDPAIIDIANSFLKEILEIKPLVSNNIVVLNALVDNKTLSWEGVLERTNNNYIFTSCEHVFNDDFKSKIQKIMLYIENDGVIDEYDVNLVYVNNNVLVLDEVHLDESKNVFGLFWKINGVAIISSKIHYTINIEYINGNYLEFYCDNIDEKNKNEINYVIVAWENDENTIIAGEIVKTFKKSDICRFTFKYTELEQKKRDYIFGQMFKKQASIRKKK